MTVQPCRTCGRAGPARPLGRAQLSLLVLILRHGPSTVRELAEMASRSQSTVMCSLKGGAMMGTRATAGLLGRGLVTATVRKTEIKGTNPYEWSLTLTGRQVAETNRGTAPRSTK